MPKVYKKKWNVTHPAFSSVVFSNFNHCTLIQMWKENWKEFSFCVLDRLVLKSTYTFWIELESVCSKKSKITKQSFLEEWLHQNKWNYDGFSILKMHKILCCCWCCKTSLEKVNCNEESILLRDPQFVRIWVSSLLLLLVLPSYQLLG